ncbi:MAG: hypothetical protein Q8S19_03590 [Bacillota bacterium]|nr:hypothetical protein [Bacillota bacterium]
MKTKPIAFLACKILAIVFFMRALLYANSTFFSFISFRNNAGELPMVIFYLILLPLLLLIVGAILWVRADGISSLMVHGLAVEETGIQIGYQELQTVGFSIVGLIIFATAIPDIFQGIPRLVSLKATNQYYIPMVKVETAFWIIEKLVRLVIGTVLLFGSGAVVRFISSIRTIGVDKTDDC